MDTSSVGIESTSDKNLPDIGDFYDTGRAIIPKILGKKKKKGKFKKNLKESFDWEFSDGKIIIENFNDCDLYNSFSIWNECANYGLFAHSFNGIPLNENVGFLKNIYNLLIDNDIQPNFNLVFKSGYSKVLEKLSKVYGLPETVALMEDVFVDEFEHGSLKSLYDEAIVKELKSDIKRAINKPSYILEGLGNKITSKTWNLLIQEIYNKNLTMLEVKEFLKFFGMVESYDSFKKIVKQFIENETSVKLQNESKIIFLSKKGIKLCKDLLKENNTNLSQIYLNIEESVDEIRIMSHEYELTDEQISWIKKKYNGKNIVNENGKYLNL